MSAGEPDPGEAHVAGTAWSTDASAVDASLPRIPNVTLHRELARGGMGVVYRGRQEFLERDVAVKLLAPHLQGEQFAARFRREAKILAGIKHPNIVACHMAGTTDSGQSYLVMEFVDGPSLKQWIGEHGALPLEAAILLTRQLASALGHAAELGVIHRDVKPENILLEAPTSTSLDLSFPFVPKLVDLGLARMTHETGEFGLTSPGAVVGTPATMAPEQFDTPDQVDFRADIYGLGCVLFQMLTGEPAFASTKLTEVVVAKRSRRSPDPCARRADIPPALGRTVAAMLASDPADRPASYRALAADLDELLAAARRPGASQAGAKASPAAATASSTAPSTASSTAPSKAPSKPSPTAPAPGSSTAPPAGAPAMREALLQTAEFEFLAADPVRSPSPTAFVESAAPPAPAIARRGAAESRKPTTVGTRPRPAAPPPPARVVGPRKRARGPRRVIAVAVAAVLGLAALPLLGPPRATTPSGTTPPGTTSPGTTPPGTAIRNDPSAPMDAVPFAVAILGPDGDVRPRVPVELRAVPTGAAGAALQCRWTAQPPAHAAFASPARPVTTLQLDGLPGDQFTVAVEVGRGADTARAERKLTLAYEPSDLFADFVGVDTAWRGRARGEWTRRKDGAVTANALDLPCFRARPLPGKTWRIAGRLRPEPGDKRPFAQAAVCLRLGPNQQLAVVCERSGSAGERWCVSLQEVEREGRPLMAFRQLDTPKAVFAIDRSGSMPAAEFTVTRRGNAVDVRVGLAGTREVAEHHERLRAPEDDAVLTLFVRSGRGVFPELELW